MLNQKAAGVFKQGWTRKCSDSVAWKKFENGFYQQQRCARRVPWDRDRFRAACKQTAKELRDTIGVLTPLPIQETRDSFRDLTRSAGANYSGVRTKAELPWDDVYRAKKELLDGTFSLPFNVCFRTQIRRSLAKRRVILVSPGPLAFLEKCFAYPIQRAMEETSCLKWWATGWDWFASGGQQVNKFTQSTDAVSMDFETFDLCRPAWMTWEIHQGLKTLLDLTPTESKLFDSISRYHCRSPFYFRGQTTYFSGGLRTGSSYTHIDGTFMAKVVMRYVLGEVESLHYGDDVLVLTSESLRSIAAKFASQTSFKISLSKSHRGVTWLGYRYKSGQWLVEDRWKRWAQIFLPSRPCSLTGRLQAAFLNSGSDPVMRHELRTILTDLKSEVLLGETIELMEVPISCCEYTVGCTSVFDLERSMKRHFDLRI